MVKSWLLEVEVHWDFFRALVEVAAVVVDLVTRCWHLAMQSAEKMTTMKLSQQGIHQVFYSSNPLLLMPLSIPSIFVAVLVVVLVPSSLIHAEKLIMECLVLRQVPLDQMRFSATKMPHFLCWMKGRGNWLSAGGSKQEKLGLILIDRVEVIGSR